MTAPPEDVETLIRGGQAWARALARQLYRRWTPGAVQLDDLESAALDGLWRAARRYDGCRPFRTYAQHHVRGALLDCLRGADPLSRQQRAAAKAAEAQCAELAHRLARPPTDEELAEAAGISPAELAALRIARPLSLDAPIAEREDGRAIRLLEQLASRQPGDDERERFERLTRGLPARTRSLLWMYYYEGQSMGAIAAQFGVTLSRGSQIHRQALDWLRRTAPEIRLD